MTNYYKGKDVDHRSVERIDTEHTIREEWDEEQVAAGEWAPVKGSFHRTDISAKLTYEQSQLLRITELINEADDAEIRIKIVADSESEASSARTNWLSISVGTFRKVAAALTEEGGND